MSNVARSHKVLIRTQPLGHNYGGLLQAYALQQVIRALGYEVDTDLSVPFRGGLRSRVGHFVRTQRRRLTDRSRRVEARALANQNLVDFRDRNVSGVRLFRSSGGFRQRVLRRYSAFVVGSDQVWRPRYSDVPACLLDFVPTDFGGPRLSYSASFGTDDTSEYSTALVERTRPLVVRV